MEGELSIRIEKLRRRVENLEDEYDKHEEWKELLNESNEVKLKIYAAGVFSENEEFKEIKAEDIKYLLISYYQAEVIQKFSENRENILNLALQFYREFYNILNKYEYLTKDRKNYYKKISGIKDKDDEDEEESENKNPSLDELSREREEKIMAFKYKKSLSDKLKVIFVLLFFRKLKKSKIMMIIENTGFLI